jgi:energy-converting hydrogenase Eha subunit A
MDRWGGLLIHPRQTLAALDPRAGRTDGRWLILLYVLGVQLIPTLIAVKSFGVNPGLGGAITFAGSMARALLGPIAVIVVAEFALGAQRSYRSNLFLVPLVAVGVVGSLLRLMGVALIGQTTLIAVGGAWALGLVFYARSEIEPDPELAEARSKEVAA